jgi:hypothetical protein
MKVSVEVRNKTRSLNKRLSCQRLKELEGLSKCVFKSPEITIGVTWEENDRRKEAKAFMGVNLCALDDCNTSES